MVNCRVQRKTIAVMAGLLVLSLSLSSCDTIRQKFTRKKKQGEVEDQNFVPVLEPEEYPTPANDPVLNYKQHYDLIKAWYQDLNSGMYERNSPAYLNDTFKEIMEHIAQMKPLVDAPTQDKLDHLATFLDYYKSSLDSWDMRNKSRIGSDLRGFDRYLRDDLRADHIKGHFIKTVPAGS